MNDEDRRILLRRRALFVSAALAATACGGAEATPKAPANTAEIPPVTTRAQSEGAAVPGRETPPERAEPPAIEIPADASEVARRMYEQLKKQVARAQIEVAGVAQSMLTCTADECRSDAAVERLAGAHASALHLVGSLEPLCPGSSEQGKAYSEVVRGQQAFFDARLASAQAQLLERMRAVGDFADRFRAAQTRASAARARPCLDCGDW